MLSAYLSSIYNNHDIEYLTIKDSHGKNKQNQSKRILLKTLLSRKKLQKQNRKKCQRFYPKTSTNCQPWSMAIQQELRFSMHRAPATAPSETSILHLGENLAAELALRVNFPDR
jgi:hypothetical protein